MWLRLATSDNKNELIELASSLRRQGAKVELRELVDWTEEEHYIIHGRVSELKRCAEAVKWKGEIDKWERWVRVLREILKEGEIPYDELIEKFMKSEDPKSYESAKKLIEGNYDITELSSSAENLIKVKTMMDELEFFLAKNGLEVGEVVRGKLPEDPEIMITVDEPIEGSKKLVLLDYFPVWELYVDVLSFLGGEVDSRILSSFLSVISNILVNIEKTEDFDKLKGLSNGIIEGENEEILINCEEVFDLILRSLEKAGIVRVSGKKVKIRKRQW